METRTSAVRAAALAMIVLTPGCGWLPRRAPVAPEAPTLVVNGLPAGARVLVDGVVVGEPMAAGARTRAMTVAAGMHAVEVKAGDKVVYRETTYLGAGETRVVTVLSGGDRG